MFTLKKELSARIFKLESAVEEIQNALGEKKTTENAGVNYFGYPIFVTSCKFTKLELLIKEIKLIKEFLGVERAEINIDIEGDKEHMETLIKKDKARESEKTNKFKKERHEN